MWMRASSPSAAEALGERSPQVSEVGDAPQVDEPEEARNEIQIERVVHAAQSRKLLACGGGGHEELRGANAGDQRVQLRPCDDRIGSRAGSVDAMKSTIVSTNRSGASQCG